MKARTNRRKRGCWRLAVVALVWWATPGHARIVDIEWDGGGRFERRMDVAPGRFAEVCGRLAAGNVVRWSFEAAASLDFNIHFHEGSKARYPAREDGARALSGVLPVDADRDYCWMWTNKSPAPVSLVINLAR
ncbi:MAG: hypothetical protein KIS74_00745 [Burkholderiales bacterium]|nr:hypothetical protein [Burkholderiales bacterium]